MSIQSDLMKFLDYGFSPFHVQENIAEYLIAQGGIQLHERESWELKSGHMYFLQRNNASLVAFRIGTQLDEPAGFRISGAHTDSPALKLKLKNTAASDNSMYTFSVEVYGSPLLYTWLDRSLGVAGRIMLRTAHGSLVKTIAVPDAGLVIPSLAIHLNRGVNDKLTLNPHTHLRTLAAYGKANAGSATDLLLQTIARRLSTPDFAVAVEDIQETDLFLYDPQPALQAGLDGSLLVAGRIDNLAGCFTNLRAFVDVSEHPQTQVAAFFEGEEIGSRTAQGADSGFLASVLERITTNLYPADPEAVFRSLARSVCISNDGAHAVHPGYPDKHDTDYSPVLNGGPIIKLNASQRYATTAVTAQFFRELCDTAEVPVQYLANRADIPTGSTIGPFCSARLQIPTVDIGIPMLAMHSIRETAGWNDFAALIGVLKLFYNSQIMVAD